MSILADPASKTPMISVAEALDRILALVEPVGTELVSLADADGRALRGDLAAARTQPPFDASAMDGYAVRSADAEMGARLRVTAEIAAGAVPPAPLAPGEAMRIFTGAPTPAGADAILLQEDATRDGEHVVVNEPATAGAWIRPSGGDFNDGDALLSAPRRLGPADVALAAAAGRPWLTVARRPRAALLAFGDELRLPGEATGPAEIVSSNTFGVAALARRSGADAETAPIVPDDVEAARAAIRRAARSDLIVTLGGASDGDHDLSRPAFAAEGMAPTFYKIAMRPGKPLMAGRLGDALVIGLPGNPVSAMVCAMLFVRPAIDALLGLTPAPPQRRRLPLAAPLEANGPREHYMRARLVTGGGETPRVAAVDSQDSSLLSRLAAADVLLIRPPRDPARAEGELVDVVDWPR